MRSLLLCIIVMVLAGCRTTKYVEIPTVRTEYIVKSDTVNTKDSVYVWNSDTIVIKGDSVFVTKWRVKETLRDVYRVRVDTLLRSDTVSVSVPIEKDYTVWDKIRLWAFFPLLIVAVLDVLYVVWKLK